MRHRTTFVLLVLFVTGLGVLWWADKADVPTREQRQERLNRLLPELIDTPVAEIRRVEIDRRTGPRKDLLRLTRWGTGWQLVEPIETAADPELVETFVRNLKDLRKSTVAGTIEGDPDAYGLKEPEAVVRVFGDNKTEPLATIALGKAHEDRGYVRSGGATGIEVVDPHRLSAATLPLAAWRDTALFRLPSFRVKGVTVQEKDKGKTIEIERDERRWRLVSPIKVPADNDKAEGLVAELTALRVPESGEGFVADNVRDPYRAAFGLDTPSMVITMTPFEGAGNPQILRLGSAVPGKSDEVYAMRGDQDEVVRLDVKRLREAMPGPNGLRSQTVLDLTPAQIDRIWIDTPRTRFDLSKTRAGWKLLSPVNETADHAAVQTLLAHLGELKTSEFLDPSRVAHPGLDAPAFRVRGWEPSPGGVSSKSTSEESENDPRFDLVLGRHDDVKNTVYGRVAGDTTILALPESILEQLPKSAFTYRDRTILSVKPPLFARITVERAGSSVTVEAPPTTGATGMQWKMVEPVAAPAEEPAVTALLLTLGNLKAESWVSDRVGDGKEFGLDAPWLRVKWTLNTVSDSQSIAPAGGRKGVLRLGTVNPKGGSVFGNIEGDERVFSLNPGVVVYLEAELHSQKVMTFKADDAVQVVLRWPSRTISLDRAIRSPGAASAWEVTPGYDPAGFDASRVDALISALSKLTTPRFLQYTGPLPAESGLAPPRVSVEVKIKGNADPLTLRVGRKMNETTSVATHATGDQGPVFVLPAGPWNDVLKLPGRLDELPEDVFAPGPQSPKPETSPR